MSKLSFEGCECANCEVARLAAERDLAVQANKLNFEKYAAGIERLKKENADLLDQLRWSLKNEQQYKDALNERFAERKQLIAKIDELQAIVDKNDQVN